MMPDGRVWSVGTGSGWVGVLGLLMLPLPPPQAERASVPARTMSAATGRNHPVRRVWDMARFLMTLS
ncbi:MAG: hypothetical protein DYH14_02335 [Betaproteobacteria bacterium PRO3]|nr:hypothetical protein [Betaproteobacteria bacterium PRO3]